MDLTTTWERPEDGPGSGPGAVLYDPPEPVEIRPRNRAHVKSAIRCPVMIQLESRSFMVKCPLDLHIGFQRDENGKAVLVNRPASGSAAAATALLRHRRRAGLDEPTFRL